MRCECSLLYSLQALTYIDLGGLFLKDAEGDDELLVMLSECVQLVPLVVDSLPHSLGLQLLLCESINQLP